MHPYRYYYDFVGKCVVQRIHKTVYKYKRNRWKVWLKYDKFIEEYIKDEIKETNIVPLI